MIEANIGVIALKSDGSERVNYQNDDFPSYLHVGTVFPGVSWINKPHFHEDLEFITITKGNTGYNINGEKILGCKVYKQDEVPENADKPYIIWSFKTNTGIELDAFCYTSETWPTSFEIGCFVKDNPEFPKINKELMDNAVLSFTYEPAEDDSITVDSSGANWELNVNWYYFTVDFDTKTFVANEER